MKEFIKNLIDKQIELYRSTPNRMVADYNSELQHINDYNGRQLLELIQNADDEKADTVALSLDTSNCTLTISNTGTPFSESGYESLTLSNLSPKTKEQYIGNKGLGFRSIINWSKEITIKSNGIDVIFSENIAKDHFDNTFSEKEKETIRSKRNLSERAIPWAILSTPIVTDGDDNKWATEIVIRYRKSCLSDIKKQLESLQKEVLLFLNNLHHLHIDIDGNTQQIAKTNNGDTVIIDGYRWHLKDTGSVYLPDDLQDKSKDSVQHYNIKIALPEKLEFKERALFSYFPTKIVIDFPFLIHGTFDLDSSRNQLNNTNKNRYVLERLVELIVDIAKDQTKDDVSWNPVRILTYNDRNPVLDDLGFYDLVDNARETMDVFPCIDKKYRKLEDICFLSNTFSELLNTTNGKIIFPNIILPIDENLEDIYGSYFSDDIEDIEVKINEYSRNLTQYPIEKRVSLIKELLIWGKGHVFSVLVNNENSIINAENEEAFTPLTRGVSNIDFPSHVKVEFINNVLFERFSKSITIGSDNKARVVQRKLREITKIQAYEPAELISKIISSTNRAIKEGKSRAKDYVIDMVTSLYLFYVQLEDETASPKSSNILLLNINNETINASDLYLGKDYLSGYYVDKIFINIYGKDSFIADKTVYGLENEDDLTVDRFFYWLGVNKYVKTKIITHDYLYEGFLRKTNNTPSNYRDSKLKASSIDQAMLAVIIKKCSLDNILLWILKDNLVRTRILETNIDEAHYSISGEYIGSHSHSYNNIPSYILYQLTSYKLFDYHLVTDDKNILFINAFKLDYKYYEDHDISKSEVDSILIKLGAKEKFEDLPIKHINSIIKYLPDHDNNGKQTQKIYKLALEHFRKNRIPLEEGVSLFAIKGNFYNYYDQSDIYYSDNAKLPSKIVNDIPLLNLPKRSGGKQVSDFFRINSLNDIKIDVLTYNTINELTKLFSKKIDLLKPYILAHRIYSIHNIRQKKIEAKSLSSLKITLCSEVRCNYDENEFHLDDFDYVYHDGIYLIKIPKYHSLEKIVNVSSFSDSFSEIICTAFKVNENKNDFRNILRNDLDDTKHIIINELGNEVLYESLYLLGISDHFVSFWSSVLKSLDIKFTEEINPKNLSSIAKVTKLEISEINDIDYSNVESDDPTIYTDLLDKAGVSISIFNNNAFYKLSLDKVHERNINNTFMQYQIQFKYLLWRKLSVSSNQEKSNFINLLTQYDHQDEWISNKSQELREVTNIDYYEALSKYIEDIFGITMSDSLPDDISQPDTTYQDNVKKLGIKNDSELSESVLSYLYFDDCIGLAKDFIQNEEDHSTDNDEDENFELSDLPTTTSEVKPPDEPPKPSKSKKGKKHSSKHDNAKMKKGLESEVIVYHALTKKYGNTNVDHVSKRDDTLGYDIRYSPDNGKTWKLVEVKSFNNSHFYLTENEKRFAENNRNDYEVYLVDQDKKISILCDVDFTNEDQFLLDINDYIVYCELQ